MSENMITVIAKTGEQAILKSKMKVGLIVGVYQCVQVRVQEHLTEPGSWDVGTTWALVSNCTGSVTSN